MYRKYLLTTFLIVFGLTLVFSLLSILLLGFIQRFIFEGPLTPFEYVYEDISKSISGILTFIFIFSLSFSIGITILGIKWYSKRR